MRAVQLKNYMIQMMLGTVNENGHISWRTTRIVKQGFSVAHVKQILKHDHGNDLCKIRAIYQLVWKDEEYKPLKKGPKARKKSTKSPKEIGRCMFSHNVRGIAIFCTYTEAHPGPHRDAFDRDWWSS